MASNPSASSQEPVQLSAASQQRISPQPFLLSVVMPVYNEEATIQEIIARVREVDIPKEIVIVDDGSQDGTRQILREEIAGKFSDVKIFFHKRNRGKGAAIRTAITHATGDYILIQDADLEYDPREYHRLLEPLLDGRADVVFGSRFLGGPHRVCFFWHRVANSLLTTYSNVMTNLNLTDMEVCYKVFRREVIQSVRLRCNRFDFEPEVTAKVAGRGYRIYEVPVSYSGRDYTEGKKIGLKDAFAAFWAITKYRFLD
ncbi:MAG: glycosyltransferase family 2 protein [Abitibacteriaceae bacterium]|nr:glycosyltransferase family 2 protein [Abditibacteriaceae bacterium]